MTVAGSVFIVFGALLMILASIGLLRLPDVFSRMHAGTKAASLGLACILLGAGLLMDDAVTTIKLGLAVVFQLMTAPVAAHLIGRAAYRAGVPLWHGTHTDELGRDTDPLPPRDDSVTSVGDDGSMSSSGRRSRASRV